MGAPRTAGEVRTTVSFEDFYRSEFPSVVGLAYALSGTRSGAEDLAQEAFLAAYRNWSRIGEYQKPGAWVRRVVANRSVSSFRRRMEDLPVAEIARVLGIAEGTVKSHLHAARSTLAGRLGLEEGTA